MAAATAETHALREAFEEFTALATEDRARVSAVEHKAAKATTRLTLGLLIVLAVAMALFLAIRVSVAQSRAETASYIRTVINTCSVGAARLPEAQVAYCERAIPGFRRARSAAAASALVNDSLRKWAEGEGWVPPTTTTLLPDPPN